MKEIRADVAVIGSGSAGIAAAIAAAEGGARVVIFEKRSVPGGFSNIPVGGLLCVESRYQKEKNYPATCDQVFRAMGDYNHWRGNSRLLRAFIDKTAGTVDWLEKQGVEFEPLPDTPPQATYSGGLFTQLHVKGRGYALMRTLRARAEEQGIKTYLKHRVTSLIKKGRCITGLTAQDEAGELVNVVCGAVVIATGGFSASKEMVKKYTGYELGKDLFPLVDIGHTGDGIRIAWQAGAAADGMGLHLYYGLPGYLIPRAQLHMVSMQPYLWLNQIGERFIDESMSNPVSVGNALARQPDHCAYLIFDGDTKKHMEEVGLDSKSPWLKMEKVDDIDEQFRSARAGGNQNLFVSETLKDLAYQLKINFKTMQKSIEEYNGYYAEGYDDFFNKDPKFLQPVRTPRFYAIRIRSGCHGSFGGIRINEKTEVIDRKNRVIPGLYAAGYDACNIYGDPTDYNWLIPGGAYSFALNSGRMAGESALEYLQI